MFIKKTQPNLEKGDAVTAKTSTDVIDSSTDEEDRVMESAKPPSIAVEVEISESSKNKMTQIDLLAECKGTTGKKDAIAKETVDSITSVEVERVDSPGGSLGSTSRDALETPNQGLRGREQERKLKIRARKYANLGRGPDEYEKVVDELEDLGEGGSSNPLERLHWVNMHRAKSVLLKDYFRALTSTHLKDKAVTKPGDGIVIPHLQEDLTRYSNALNEYRAIVEHQIPKQGLLLEQHAIRGRPYMQHMSFEKHLGFFEAVVDETLRNNAMHSVAIEEFGSRLRKAGKDEAEIVQELLVPRQLLQVSETRLTRTLLSRGLDNRKELKFHFMDGGPLALAGIKAIQDVRKLMERLYMALFGGLILIAPMLIMRLQPTLERVVLTTSIFVIVVGILLAVTTTDSQPKDILAATAAYAAVLVVFVGQGIVTTATSLSSGSIAGLAVGTTVGALLLITTPILVYKRRAGQRWQHDQLRSAIVAQHLPDIESI